MDINILEEFVSLVETNSFQKTAAVMNVSQSALTKHIQKLENELGVSLFERSVRSFATNEYGKLLYPFAKQIIETSKEAVTSLRELSNEQNNTFSVAYAPILGQYGLIDLIAEYSKTCSYNTMRVVETYTPMNLLNEGKCDFAFLGESGLDDSKFNKLIYVTDHLAVVLPKNHRFANRQNVSLEELEDENFILHANAVGATPHEETQKFLDLCEKKHFTPRVVAESQYSSTMVRYVQRGVGIAILNRIHIPQEAETACVVVDLSPIVYSYIYLLYRRKLSCPSAVDFLHFMVEKIR